MNCAIAIETIERELALLKLKDHFGDYYEGIGMHGPLTDILGAEYEAPDYLFLEGKLQNYVQEKIKLIKKCDRILQARKVERTLVKLKMGAT
jgi:hypothetical protein